MDAGPPTDGGPRERVARSGRRRAGHLTRSGSCEQLLNHRVHRERVVLTSDVPNDPLLIDQDVHRERVRTLVDRGDFQIAALTRELRAHGERDTDGVYVVDQLVEVGGDVVLICVDCDDLEPFIAILLPKGDLCVW